MYRIDVEIACRTRKRLCDVKGLSEAKVEKIKEIAAKLSVSVSSYNFLSSIFLFHCLIAYAIILQSNIF